MLMASSNAIGKASEMLGNAKKYVKQYSHEKIWQEWDSVLKQLMQRRTHE